MSNEQLVTLLRDGAMSWNAWRKEQGFFRPDLRDADLSGLLLQQVNLQGADLDGADLSGCSLSGGRLASASLIETNLERAALREVAMSDCHLDKASLKDADLHSADLNGASFSKANLTNTNFESANLSMASLIDADLSGARLVGAKLNDVTVKNTNFFQAIFGARYKTGELPEKLRNNFPDLIKDGQDIGQFLAFSGKTSLCNVDLSSAQNLATIIHDGPSSIGIDTLMVSAKSLYGHKDCMRQAGEIEILLRGAGVHEEVLQLFPILLRHPIFYSVFISYSHRDHEFAKKIHKDLEESGVKVWRDEKNSQAGAGISETLKKAIRNHDRILILCSRSSLGSLWVADELEYAREKELETSGQPIVIPLFLDASINEWTKREKGLFVDRFAINFDEHPEGMVEYQAHFNILIDTLRTFK